MSSGAFAAEVIELSSDEEADEEPAPGASALALARRAPSSPPDVKPRLLADAGVKLLLLPPLDHPPGYGALVPVKAEEPVPVATASPPPRLCRQFWKSGDYVVAHRNPDADAPGGRNRLRINPRFLHSNATSHKWAFGAIAELLDNAIDEIIMKDHFSLIQKETKIRYESKYGYFVCIFSQVNNRATFVHINKFINPRDGNPSLLVQDNGGECIQKH